MRLSARLFAFLLTGSILVASGASNGVAAAARGPTRQLDSTRQSEWHWPLAPPLQVLRPFEAPPTRYAAGHRGIDLAAAEGAVVLAVADGTVSFAGTVVDRPIVSVSDVDGVLSSIEPVSPTVVAGDRVRRGDPIGVVGAGGHCSGRCIHLGARVEGEYVSPLLFLGGIPRAVLLPLG